jgi:hypothetical protein
VTASTGKALFQGLFGQPLPRSQAGEDRLPSCEALSIFSSDALSSVAYATEAALEVLILAGSGALSLSLPIPAAIVALIAIVVFSHRQTIGALLEGGGSHQVALENLRTLPA